jgi:two-component system cell cycle sensor histidine kinase/response regulator CckA
MRQSLKILIIDDDENILSNLCHFLKNKNYDVTPASNGFEGLKLFENHPQGFDLIITDIVMPQISGTGFISIIKKRFPDIRIIAISGWGEYPSAFSLESQADRVLSKPFDLSELDKAISELISSKKNKIQD